MLVAAAPGVLAIGCDSSDPVKETPPVNNPSPDPTATSTSDAGTLPDGGSLDCFEHPTTHYEIINACTNAQAIDKQPNLPLLYPDGGLPPTP
jgi:hypothetical protein